MQFNVKLLAPCNVGTAVHQAFSIFTTDDKHVGSGLNVELADNRRVIRIFDYDVPYQADMKAYFSSRTKVSEVTFSRPM